MEMAANGDEPPDSAGGELKRHVASRTGVPPHRQRAFLAHAELNDGDTINFLFHQGGLAQKGMHLALWLGQDSEA